MTAMSGLNTYLNSMQETNAKIKSKPKKKTDNAVELALLNFLNLS